MGNQQVIGQITIQNHVSKSLRFPTSRIAQIQNKLQTGCHAIGILYAFFPAHSNISERIQIPAKNVAF